MKQLVTQFPIQIEEAVKIAKQSTYSFYENKDFDHVVICGMGGSGIGGKLVAQLFEKESKIPIVLVQDYSIPGFVNEKTLVISSSYSGTTEETLSVIEFAESKGATIVGVSSGGDLIKLCREKGYDYVELPSGNPPRSMLAFSSIQLIKILHVAGIVKNNFFTELENSAQTLKKDIENIQSQAKELANLFFKKQGIIYSDAEREVVALRARQQFNENSKQLVWHHVIPEMNHNELVGWGGGNDGYAVVFFVSQFLSKRNLFRTSLCSEIIRKKTPHVMEINGKGDSVIEENLYFIHIIDWTSIYLADLNQQDAVEVKVIDYLKSNLNKE
ncbi:MAG: bifunctional phosphoglucose/phosphomannose isomerase [Brumimicrobium sp.]